MAACEIAPWRTSAIAGALWLLVCTAASAQPTTGSATLAGRVQRDSAGTPVPDARVALPQLQREAITDSRGEFRLGELPAGTFELVIRGIGFAPRTDTVTLVAGRTTDRTVILSITDVRLDSVRVVGAAPRYVSPMLRAFEERRQAGHGRFITEDELRESDDRAFSSIIQQRIPGIRVEPRGGGLYLATTRTAPRRIGEPCWVSVYMDGVPLSTAGRPAVDISRLQVNQFAGVEYYPGGATVPAQFNRTRSACDAGVLLLWTREQ